MALALMGAVLSGSAKQAAPQQEPESDVLRAGPGITNPELMYKVEPEYSEAALKAGIQGTILLDLVIDEQGLPQDVAVLSPLGFGLDEQALRAVSNWRFKPATKDGNPVKFQAQVEVNFRLLGKNFDSKAEEQRTRFNAIVTRTARQKDKKPSDQDLKAMQNLAKQKLAAAEYVLGAWEVTGDIVPKDVSGGLASIQRAADKKYGPALFFIGKSEMEGDLLLKDPAQGLSLIREAAELGSKQAQFTLGAMYEKGDGVAVDPDRARKYFRLCAAYGTPECEFRLGKLLLDSPEHKKRDWLQAVAWLELAEDHNLAAARRIVEPEVAKLTPQEAKSLARLESQLEHRP